MNWIDFNKLGVLIVGDVMIDRYLTGSVERISPEAPVPVVLLSGREDRLGGAANVALNVQAMGAAAYLCSVTGRDVAGDEFAGLMAARALDAEGIIRRPGRITTVKTRVMSGAQHLLRIDEEVAEDITPEEEKLLLRAVLNALDSRPVHVIIFQDYNKGVLTSGLIAGILREAQSRGIPTVVDPKEKNFWAYRGVQLFKPNLREIRRHYPGEVLPEIESLQETAAYIREQLGNSLTLITLSEKGLFVDDAGKSELLPTQPRVIADVSGAGDTVISVAALCLALGVPPRAMAAIANLAGGQVCERPGVVSVDKTRLESECRSLGLTV